MDRFVSRENIKRYRKLASESTDAVERSRIIGLLAEEEAKLKSEPSHCGESSAGHSPVKAATENGSVSDAQEQRSRG